MNALDERLLARARMETARAALLEAAAELASLAGTPERSEIRTQLGAARHPPAAVANYADAIANIYAANEEWQDAQIEEAGADCEHCGGSAITGHFEDCIQRAAAANLTKAAPELLDVCEIILDAANDRAADSLGHELPPRIRALLCAAIAKARGSK